MKQNDRRPRPVNGIVILGACYVLYMAVRLADTLISGESTYPILSAVAAALFAVAGVWFLWREWKAWRAVQKAAEEEREEEP